MNILLVDDDVISRKVTKSMCQKMGHRVQEASGGKQALRLYKKNPYSVVISDWVMPDLDGLDLCKEIRKNKNKNSPFFFLVTGKKTGVGNYSQAMTAGVDDYIFKPVDFHVLNNQLRVAERFLGLIQ